MEKLSPREKAGYSIGEFGGSGYWQIFLIFLPFFLTDIFGISAIVASNLLLYSRLFDAVNDPVMGIIADRTKTRWGRYRPYLLWMAVPFVICGMAVFWAPDLSESGKVIYAYVTYFAMMMIYTAMMIPFSALSGVMTSNHIDRTSLNSYRFFFAFSCNFIVLLFFEPLVEFFGQGDDVVGYRWTIFILSMIALVFFVTAFISTKERVQKVEKADQNIGTDVKDLFQNLPWLIVLVVSLITLIYIVLRGSVQAYYFNSYIETDFAIGVWVLNFNAFSLFLGVGTLATLVGVMATNLLIKLMGKRTLIIISSFLAALTNVGFYFVGPQDIVFLFVVQVVSSVVLGPLMPILWSMMGDAADYGEWKTGRRATGLVFSASTLAFKAGAAIGGALALRILGEYGYDAGAESQSAEVIEVIKQMMSYYPAAGAALCGLLFFIYPLSRARMDQIEAELTIRREAEEITP